jgi:hypothetical protein
VNVFGHDDVAANARSESVASGLQFFLEDATRIVIVEQWAPLKATEGYEMKLARLLVPPQTKGHDEASLNTKQRKAKSKDPPFQLLEG